MIVTVEMIGTVMVSETVVVGPVTVLTGPVTVTGTSLREPPSQRTCR